MKQAFLLCFWLLLQPILLVKADYKVVIEQTRNSVDDYTIMNLADIQFFNGGNPNRLLLSNSLFSFTSAGADASYPISNCNDGNTTNMCRSGIIGVQTQTIVIDPITVPFDKIIVYNCVNKKNSGGFDIGFRTLAATIYVTDKSNGQFYTKYFVTERLEHIFDIVYTSFKPTMAPTTMPSRQPTGPTIKPTIVPTVAPTRPPTRPPTKFPTKSPAVRSSGNEVIHGSPDEADKTDKGDEGPGSIHGPTGDKKYDPIEKKDQDNHHKEAKKTETSTSNIHFASELVESEVQSQDKNDD